MYDCQVNTVKLKLLLHHGSYLNAKTSVKNARAHGPRREDSAGRCGAVVASCVVVDLCIRESVSYGMFTDVKGFDLRNQYYIISILLLFNIKYKTSDICCVLRIL